MVHLESEHCVVSCGYTGLITEIAADFMAIALAMYCQLLELDAEAAGGYVELMRDFANDPAAVLDKCREDPENTDK